MNMKAMEYVIALSENRSFSETAKKYYITQSALSQQIKKVEESIGAQLFYRNYRYLNLTESGEVFVRESRRILQIYKQMQKRIQSIETKTAEIVHFGISPFYSRCYLSHLLTELISSAPDIKFEVMENYSSEIEKALLNGDLDFCLAPQIPMNPLISYDPVYEEHIVLAIPKDSSYNKFAVSADDGGLPYLSLEVLDEMPFLSLKNVQKFSKFQQQLFETAGINPQIICETMNWDTINVLVSDGLGAGLVPAILMDRIPMENRPCYYRLNPDVKRLYAVATRCGDTLSESASRTVETFRRVFAEKSNSEEQSWW